MALLDDMKVSARVSAGTDDFDSELQDIIDAALIDLQRKGIKTELLDEDDPDKLVKQAVRLYVKAHFGYDNSERGEFLASYDQTVIDLLNSSANSADQDD